MDPRVRFVVLFGVSSATSLAATFFSSSRWANDLTEVAPAALCMAEVEEEDGALGVDNVDEMFADVLAKGVIAAEVETWAMDPAGVFDADLVDDVDDWDEGRDKMVLAAVLVCAGCGVAVRAVDETRNLNPSTDTFKQFTFNNDRDILLRSFLAHFISSIRLRVHLAQFLRH